MEPRPDWDTFTFGVDEEVEILDQDGNPTGERGKIITRWKDVRSTGSPPATEGEDPNNVEYYKVKVGDNRYKKFLTRRLRQS